MSPFSRSLIAAAVSVSAISPLVAQSRYSDWLERPFLTAFGMSVALSGDELFIGRTGVVPGFPMPPSQTGAVHVYRRGAEGSWSEVAAVASSDAKLGDGFGSSLAVDGTLLVVGAPKSGGSGAVYVFEKRGNTWSQVARLTSPSPREGAEFGHAVALGGGGGGGGAGAGAGR